MCLVWLRVHAAIGSFSVVLSLFFLGVVLVKVPITLGYGVLSIVTLIDDGMADGVDGGGNVSGTLGDICLLLSSVFWLLSRGL